MRGTLELSEESGLTRLSEAESLGIQGSECRALTSRLGNSETVGDLGRNRSVGWWGQRPAQGGARSSRRGRGGDRVSNSLKGFCCFAAGGA